MWGGGSARAGNIREIVNPEQMELVLEGSDSLHRRMAALDYTLFSDWGLWSGWSISFFFFGPNLKGVTH